MIAAAAAASTATPELGSRKHLARQRGHLLRQHGRRHSAIRALLLHAKEAEQLAVGCLHLHHHRRLLAAARGGRGGCGWGRLLLLLLLLSGGRCAEKLCELTIEVVCLGGAQHAARTGRSGSSPLQRAARTGAADRLGGSSEWLRVAVVAVLAWGLRSGTLHQPGLTCERKASPRQPATPHIEPDMARLRLLLV